MAAICGRRHIARLRPDLASKYAPLTVNGNGLQSVYLTPVSAALATTLFGLIGKEATVTRSPRSNATRPPPSGT